MSSKLQTDSIAARLARHLVLTVSALLLVFALGVEVLFVHHLRSEFDRALLARAQSLSTLLEQDEDGVDFDFASEAMPEFAAGPAAEYFQLWLSDWPQPRRAAALGNHDLPRFATRSAAPRYRDLLLPDGRAGRAVQLDFLARLDPKEHLEATGIKRPLASLVAARDRGPLERLIGGLRAGLASLVVIGFGLSAYLVRHTVKRGLQPLTVMRAQIANMHATTLHERITLPDNAAELAPLVGQFNALLSDLEEAFRREQDFALAAAHELRTPLAEIRSLAEIGARFADDRALASEYFADIVAAVTQMENLARNLLALARHDHNLANDLEREDVDVIAMVAEIWRTEAATINARDLTFRYSGPSAVSILAARKLLDLLLRNVIGNAVAHCPAGGEISLHCETDSSGLSLAVANPRGELEASDLPHVFERFWRKDAARADSDHSGLGLALVRACATQLKLQSSAMLDDEGRFVLRLEGFTASSTQS